MIVRIIFLSILLIMLLQHIFFNNNLFTSKSNKGETYLKTLVILFIILSFIDIFLPDSYIVVPNSVEELGLLNNNIDYLQVIVRWGNSILPLVFIGATFYNKNIFKAIAIFFCLPILIISIINLPTFVNLFVSDTGLGLNTIKNINTNFQSFILNRDFRTIFISLKWSIGLIICLSYLTLDKFKLRFIFNDYKLYLDYFIILFSLLILMIPIYIPQMIFGRTNIHLQSFTQAQIIWIIILIVAFIVLFYHFYKKSYYDRYLLCLILSIALAFQYSYMYSLECSISRLPLHPCNLASYLYLIAILTKNRYIFNFNLIINVIGGLFAVIVINVNDIDLTYVWSFHYLIEHTYVVLIPIITLALGLFPIPENSDIKNILKGFTIYFIFCLVINIVFQNIAGYKNDDYFRTNFFFLMEKSTVTNISPRLEFIFNTEISIFYAKLYPRLLAIIYFGFSLLCISFQKLINYIVYLNRRFEKKVLQENTNDYTFK